MPKITIRVANAEKLETQFLPELASGGLFIRSDKFLPLGSEVDIDLYLPSASEALPLRGRVTKVVDDDEARARKATGMTLAVDANSEPTRSRLDALYAAYKIPTRKPPNGDVSPGMPAHSGNGHSHGNGHSGATVVPLPAPSRPSLPDADDNLPSSARSSHATEDIAPPPSIAPTIPSVAPVIPPSIPTLAPPQSAKKVDVVRFDRSGRTSSQDAIPLPGGSGPGPVPSLELGAEPTPPSLHPQAGAGGDRPLPFPFSRNAPPPAAPPVIPAFGEIAHAPPPPPREEEHVAPPPPPPAAAREEARAPSSADAGRTKQLEAELDAARAQAKKATSEKEAVEAKHAEAVKRLNDELAKLQRQKGGERRSPVPAALLGLLVGAGATAAYFLVVAPQTQPKPTQQSYVATNTPMETKTPDQRKPPPDNSGNSGGSQTKTPDTNTTGSAAALTAMKTQDAGTQLAENTAPVVAAVPDAGHATDLMAGNVKDAGAMLAAADVKPDVKPQEKAEPLPGLVPDQKKPEEVKPPEEKKPVADTKAEEKTAEPNPENETAKPEHKGPAPLAANAGTLNLKADLPATVFVNGKKVGNAPILGVKVNPGKITVRFDCVVEDVRVRGKNKTVNVPPNGSVNVDNSCVE